MGVDFIKGHSVALNGISVKMTALKMLVFQEKAMLFWRLKVCNGLPRKKLIS